MACDAAGKPHALHALWNRRQTTKFNGVSYPIQKAAAAAYSPEGLARPAPSPTSTSGTPS
jgi:LL-diaminopimelate aminotransferase